MSNTQLYFTTNVVANTHKYLRTIIKLNEIKT